jgi:multiple antibiotic resistance protein
MMMKSAPAATFVMSQSQFLLELHPLTIFAALIGSALIALSIFLCYGFADRLARVLGPTGMSVMIELSSFLLLCIGAQIVWNGTKPLLESVTVHIAP